MPEIKWNIAGGGALGPAPFLIAGIVNVTPDSFYDGGRHCTPSKAVNHGMELVRQGAAILDIGGESTRPYAERVDVELELERVIPVIQELAGREMPGPEETLVRPAISVDTYKARVAAQALDAGAAIINDVSAFRFDPELLDVVGQYKPGYVLMHSLGRPEEMQDAPHYENVVDALLAFFEERLILLDKAGLPRQNVVLDPGIGFGKLLEHNLALLKDVGRFMEFGLPIYMGLSNKSLWQELLGLEPDQRGGATQVATALLAAKGVFVHRVHDVAATRQSLTIVQEIA